ncbi:MAG TPA: bifunctional riboflavin kinase/FAD synthetase [Buchnera sp. (in: enterobacteria)]|nr:bifunctional riboflavin kinase/FAD synthetase [Buchnera sp. (in: enterobacteria)]
MKNIQDQYHDCIITIGNFDGVHLGHQYLLQFMCKQKKIHNKPVIIVLFEPQPLEFLQKKIFFPRLTTLSEKIKHFSSWNIDRVVCIRFNHKFSILSANKFISDILVQKLKVKFLVVGLDFCFGKNKEGNLSLLKEKGKIYNFHVINPKTIYKNNIRISSTAIRNALLNDNFKLAQSLLGYPFSISGKVIHGLKKGREIGFPTANISLSKRIMPVKGVYAVRVPKLFKKDLFGVANIGIKPSFSCKIQQLEVHLFDITVNLYEKYIEVILCKKIRNERFFSSIKELKSQISQDILIARNYFSVCS